MRKRAGPAGRGALSWASSCAAALLVASGAFAAPADSSGVNATRPAPATGTGAAGTVAAPAPGDTSAVARGAPSDSASLAAVPRPAPRPERGDINSDRLRYDGRSSPLRLFESRWPVDAVELPLTSLAFSSPRSLDAGVPLDGWRSPATDRTPVSSLALSLGMPNAATAVGAPSDAISDPFLVTRWEVAAERPLMRGPAELLARPRAVLWWDSTLAARKDLTSSALFYEKGELGVVQAGARFVAPGLFGGLAGAYVRRETEGEDAWFRALDTRYALVGNLARVAGWSSRVEGDIANRVVESSVPNDSTVRVAAGETRFEHQSLRVRAERSGRAWRHTLEAGVTRASHTLVGVDNVRERWEEPRWNAEVASTWRPAPGWTWMATARAMGRGIHSRVGPGKSQDVVVSDEFSLTRNEGRAGVAVRHESAASGTTRGWSADVAVDTRAHDAGFVDGRLGVFAASRRGIAQLDLETAHERPTWEDRLTPARERIVSADGFLLTKTLRYVAAADPTIEARRLTGGAARGLWRPHPGTEFEATASARRVTDDFGWDLTRTETADTILVEDRATRRGSGWTAHGSLAAAATWRSFRARVLGWARGGDRALTPLAGGAARVGLDASLEAGSTFFQGDLPLRAGLDAHVTGDRGGAFRTAGAATVDASLRADFDQAGLYFRIDDLFDRRLPSGAYDLPTGVGVPSAGRRFRFGVVWHLSD